MSCCWLGYDDASTMSGDYCCKTRGRTCPLSCTKKLHDHEVLPAVGRSSAVYEKVDLEESDMPPINRLLEVGNLIVSRIAYEELTIPSTCRVIRHHRVTFLLLYSVLCVVNLSHSDCNEPITLTTGIRTSTNHCIALISWMYNCATRPRGSASEVIPPTTVLAETDPLSDTDQSFDHLVATLHRRSNAGMISYEHFCLSHSMLATSAR
jgi:hypothetical protein